mmetsp:Transcript_33387/g.93695  ORF Transcript_33387/g.93695 Transcript_33387/m.93695 type:complete len:275 (-) Transcript_33387:693-1517(-)
MSQHSTCREPPKGLGSRRNGPNDNVGRGHSVVAGIEVLPVEGVLQRRNHGDKHKAIAENAKSLEKEKGVPVQGGERGESQIAPQENSDRGENGNPCDQPGVRYDRGKENEDELGAGETGDDAPSTAKVGRTQVPKAKESAGQEHGQPHTVVTAQKDPKGALERPSHRQEANARPKAHFQDHVSGRGRKSPPPCVSNREGRQNLSAEQILVAVPRRAEQVHGRYPRHEAEGPDARHGAHHDLHGRIGQKQPKRNSNSNVHRAKRLVHGEEQVGDP